MISPFDRPSILNKDIAASLPDIDNFFVSFGEVKSSTDRDVAFSGESDEVGSCKVSDGSLTNCSRNGSGTNIDD